MAKTTITFEDAEEGVIVTLNFGDIQKSNEPTEAQRLAMMIVSKLNHLLAISDPENN